MAEAPEPPPEAPPTFPYEAVVLYPYKATDTKELTVVKGDNVTVNKANGWGWIHATLIDRATGHGWIPATYVAAVEPDPDPVLLAPVRLDLVPEFSVLKKRRRECPRPRERVRGGGVQFSPLVHWKMQCKTGMCGTPRVKGKPFCIVHLREQQGAEVPIDVELVAHPVPPPVDSSDDDSSDSTSEDSDSGSGSDSDDKRKKKPRKQAKKKGKKNKAHQKANEVAEALAEAAATGTKAPMSDEDDDDDPPMLVQELKMRRRHEVAARHKALAVYSSVQSYIVDTEGVGAFGAKPILPPKPATIIIRRPSTGKRHHTADEFAAPVKRREREQSVLAMAMQASQKREREEQERQAREALLQPISENEAQNNDEANPAKDKAAAVTMNGHAHTNGVHGMDLEVTKEQHNESDKVESNLISSSTTSSSSSSAAEPDLVEPEPAPTPEPPVDPEPPADPEPPLDPEPPVEPPSPVPGPPADPEPPVPGPPADPEPPVEPEPPVAVEPVVVPEPIPSPEPAPVPADPVDEPVSTPVEAVVEKSDPEPEPAQPTPEPAPEPAQSQADSQVEAAVATRSPVLTSSSPASPVSLVLDIENAGTVHIGLEDEWKLDNHTVESANNLPPDSNEEAKHTPEEADNVRAEEGKEITTSSSTSSSTSPTTVADSQAPCSPTVRLVVGEAGGVDFRLDDESVDQPVQQPAELKDEVKDEVVGQPEVVGTPSESQSEVVAAEVPAAAAEETKDTQGAESPEHKDQVQEDVRLDVQADGSVLVELVEAAATTPVAVPEPAEASQVLQAVAAALVAKAAAPEWVFDETKSDPVEPSTVVEPVPAEPTPVDPTPVDPTPVEPSPVDPTPVEPVPVDPTPVEPAIAIPVEPSEPAEPVEPTPATPEATPTIPTTTTADPDEQPMPPPPEEPMPEEPKRAVTPDEEAGPAGPAPPPSVQILVELSPTSVAELKAEALKELVLPHHHFAEEKEKRNGEHHHHSEEKKTAPLHRTDSSDNLVGVAPGVYIVPSPGNTRPLSNTNRVSPEGVGSRRRSEDPSQLRAMVMRRARDIQLNLQRIVEGGDAEAAEAAEEALAAEAAARIAAAVAAEEAGQVEDAAAPTMPAARQRRGSRRGSRYGATADTIHPRGRRASAMPFNRPTPARCVVDGCHKNRVENKPYCIYHTD